MGVTRDDRAGSAVPDLNLAAKDIVSLWINSREDAGAGILNDRLPAGAYLPRECADLVRRIEPFVAHARALREEVARLRAEVGLYSRRIGRAVYLARQGGVSLTADDLDTTGRVAARSLLAENARLRAAAMIVLDWIDAHIQDCCGAEVGAQFCEQYGCGTLLQLADPLRAALAPEAPPATTTTEGA